MRDADIIDAIIDAIRNGELDLHVEALAEVASRRVQLLQAARDAVLMATIRKGDRVEINHSARPLYLHGEAATVIGLAHDTVVVLLDRPVGRFTNGEVRCPPGVLQPLGPGPEYLLTGRSPVPAIVPRAFHES